MTHDDDDDDDDDGEGDDHEDLMRKRLFQAAGRDLTLMTAITASKDAAGDLQFSVRIGGDIDKQHWAT